MAKSSPDAPAVIGAGGALTYGELDRRVSAVQTKLGELGLGAGDRVALYAPKDERYIVLLLALIRAGCVACLLSTRLPPRGAVPLLKGAACRALISDVDLPSEASDADVGTFRPASLLTDGPAHNDRARSPAPRFLPLDSAATIVFTSGSTGAPKAAVHTFGNHYYSALGSNANIALAPGDRWLHSLPLYHVGGLSILFRCLLAGATVALPEGEASLGEAIVRSGATHVSLVPTQLLRLLREGAGPGSLKAMLLGGEPVSAALVDRALARRLPVHTSYGLTEMASQVTATPPGASRAELRTSGRLLPYRDASVADDGEIRVRGETLFAGYVEGGSVTLPLDADGWFCTGDLGAFDASGYLRVFGRRDNLFISGGENIQPEEIEGAISRLEGVEGAVVVPIPDAEFGLRPVAFVRGAPAAGPPGDLAKALEPFLPRFKIPVAFHAWPEDTASGGMKVDRAALARRASELRRRRDRG